VRWYGVLDTSGHPRPQPMHQKHPSHSAPGERTLRPAACLPVILAMPRTCCIMGDKTPHCLQPDPPTTVCVSAFADG
jgi:hypothetical protein